ncbi:MAG: response regulator [Cyanobacteria bacterium P01_D01_bin.156]
MKRKSIILIVEDEVHIRNALQRHLTRAGYDVLLAADGEDAIAQFRAYDIDLVVLDILIPKLDGLEVCQRIREESDVPIIIATVLGSTADRVAGLDLGATDYIVKPFSSRELVARIRTILRRVVPQTLREQQSSTLFNDMESITVGGLTLHPQTRKVYNQTTHIRFTEIEFHILYLLAQAPGEILTRETILQNVWGYADGSEVETKALDVHISHVRTKLGRSSVRIMTIQGRGYMLLTR